jgi:hypothetical protein
MDQRIVQNFEPKKVASLASQIPLEKGSIVSKILAQNDAVSLTLFSLAEGQEIATHQSDGDALVQVLEGEGTSMSMAPNSTSRRAKLSSCRTTIRMPSRPSTISRCS